MMRPYKAIYALLLILTFLSVSTDCRAAYVKVNRDDAVNGFLSGSFISLHASEKANTSNLREIRKAYEGAKLAIAGIYDAKKIERKWRSDATGLVYNSMEGYYYQEIYSMVKDRIIPRIYRTAILCIHYPDQVDVWLPILFRICSETESLCSEFSNVVCNGRLTFNDIRFPQIADELLEMFGITQLRDVNWQDVIDDITHIDDNLPDISMDDLKADMENIIDLATELGKETWQGVEGMWDERGKVKEGWESVEASGKGKSNVIKYLTRKFKQIKASVDSMKTIYGNYSDHFDMKGHLQGFMGALDSTNVMNKLFKYRLGLPEEDLKNDIKIEDDRPQFYRQKYCIVKKYKDAGEWKSETIFDYKPPFDGVRTITDIKNRYYDDWIHVNNLQSIEVYVYGDPSDESNSRFESERQQALDLSKARAGFDSDRNEYQGNDTVKFETSYHLVTEKYISSVGVGWYVFAYEIKVIKKTLVRRVKEEEMYCEWFDSHDADSASFENYFATKAQSYITERFEPDKTTSNQDCEVLVVKGEKIPYTEADERRMEGCTAVEFIASCHDGGELGSQNTEWRENAHGHNPLCEWTKELAMTDIVEYDKNTECLDNLRAMMRAKEDSIQQLRSDIDALNAELEEVNKQITFNFAPGLREKRENLISQIDRKEAAVNLLNSQLAELQGHESEAIDDANNNELSVRIPWHMRYYTEFFPELEWTDEGHWEEYTFVRHATIKGLGGNIKFSAKLEDRKHEQYFLGIRYHRSRVGIVSKMTYDSDTEETVGYMEFPESLSAAEKVQRVNERRQELQQDFEDCSITIQESYNELKKDDDEEVVHLLWPSERLHVARQIYGRLNAILSHLVLTEMFLQHCDRNRLNLSRLLNNTMNMTSTRTSLYLNNILVGWRVRAHQALAARREE